MVDLCKPQGYPESLKGISDERKREIAEYRDAFIANARKAYAEIQQVLQKHGVELQAGYGLEILIVSEHIPEMKSRFQLDFDWDFD